MASVLAPLVFAFLAMLAAYAGVPRAFCFDVASTFAALGALAAMVHARGRARPANRLRWTLWAIAAGSWLVGQLGWDLLAVVGFPASPSVADFGWYGFALLVMVSMLRVPRSPRPVQVVLVFETLPLIFAAVALSLAIEWSQAGASELALAPKLAALA